MDRGSEFEKDLDYGGAFTLVVERRLTLVAEATGRRLSSIGRLADLASPHPQLANVETIRLSSTEEPTHRLVAVGGLKWNAAASWLLNINVLRPLTVAGLNAKWTPSMTLDYSLVR